MNRLLTCCAVLIIALSSVASAQDDPPPPPEGFGGGRGGARLQHFKKLRLIEELKLGEEESVRFFARQRAHEEKMRDLMSGRNDVVGRLDKMIENQHTQADVQKLCDQIRELDRKIVDERERFFDEQRKALTPEQFARFLVFEWKFGRQVRDAMGERFRKRHGSDPGNPED